MEGGDAGCVDDAQEPSWPRERIGLVHTSHQRYELQSSCKVQSLAKAYIQDPKLKFTAL